MTGNVRAVLDSVKAPDASRAAREFVAQAGRDAAFQLETCVHCGQCADACHFHMVSGDARHTPIYKLQPMLKAYQREAAPFASVKKLLGLAPPELRKPAKAPCCSQDVGALTNSCARANPRSSSRYSAALASGAGPAT